MNETTDLLNTLPKEFSDKLQHILASKGFSVDSQWFDYNALNIACEYKQAWLAKFLLEQNCRVNKPASCEVFEKTPLHYAVKHADTEIVSILLSKQASLLASDSDGNTPLHLAFLQRQEEIVDLMMTAIEQTSNYDNAKNNQGLSHMHIACTRSNTKVISAFVKAGASVQDPVNSDSTLWANFTAMHFAVQFKSLKAVTFLKKISIDDSSDSSGLTPLDLATQQLDEMTLIVQQLSKKSNPDSEALSQFHLACTKDNPALLEKFIENGADVNNPIGESSVLHPLYRPLHFAVESKSSQNVAVLLKHGAEVNHANDQGMTPLHLAFYKRDRSEEKDAMVSMLYSALKNVVEDNRTDENGLSYYQIAVAQNDLQTVKEFLNKGESVNWSVSRNPRNFTNFTPLHFATLHGHKSMAELLIGCGAYVNANDEADRGTALHVALELANFELVELLLMNGALASAVRFKTGKTTIHLLVDTCKRLAKEGSAEESSKYFERLAKFGCEVDAKDSNGDTALHLACSDDFRHGVVCAKRLLELGADVNSKNCWGSTPFTECLFGDAEEAQRGEPADYAILYEHVQKLKDLGWTVDPKNVECCEALLGRLRCEWGWVEAEEFEDETLATRMQRRINEVEKMKDAKLTSYLSLYDYMQFDAKRAAVHARNATLKEILENQDFMSQLYPEFGCLMRLQYAKALDQLVPS